MTLLPLNPRVKQFLSDNREALTRQNVARQHVPQEGPGTEFARIAKQLGYPTCGMCAVTLAMMNQLGPDGCEQHFAMLLTRLRQTAAMIAAKEKGKPLRKRLAGRMALAWRAVASGVAFRLNPLDALPGLLRLAIQRDRERIRKQS